MLFNCTIDYSDNGFQYNTRFVQADTVAGIIKMIDEIIEDEGAIFFEIGPVYQYMGIYENLKGSVA